jgi:hypothetical protein
MLTGTILLVTIPSTNGNGYGNSYGNSSNNTRAAPSKLEVMLKDFIGKQTAFNRSIEEKLGKIDILASKVDSFAHDVELLKLKVFPNDVKENNTFSTTNAIQVRIDENVRMLAELHARWEREDEMARKMKVCIITISNDVVPNASNPLTLICVEKTPTPSVKKPKTAKKNPKRVLKFFGVWEMIALLLLMILMLMAAIYLKLFCSCNSLL